MKTEKRKQAKSGISFWPLLSVSFALLAVIASFSNHPHEVRTPTHIDASDTPPHPHDTPWAVTSGRNGNLSTMQPTLLAHEHIHFAETVFVRPGSDCEAYATDNRGRIWLLQPAESKDQRPTLVAHVGGTLLGGAFDANGGIYVADATRGLFYIPPLTDGVGFGTPRLVAARAPSGLTHATSEDGLDEAEIRYCNDIAVDMRTGLVYFTESTKIAPVVYSTRRGDTFRSYATSHLTADATGRLLVYDPRTDATHVLVTHIPFANGVGVSGDGKRVIFASTSSYTVRSVPTLDAAYNTAPSTVRFDDAPLFYRGRTPGMIDGITVDDEGNVFFPVFGPILRIMRFTDHAPNWVRRVLAMVPMWMRPKPNTVYTMIVELDKRGELKRVLHDTERKYGLLTSMATCKKYLFCGALKGHFGVRMKIRD